MKTSLNDLRCNLVILRSSWASWKIVENLEVPRNHVTKHSGARPPTWKISATLWKLNLNVAKTWYQKVLGTMPSSIYIYVERERELYFSFLFIFSFFHLSSFFFNYSSFISSFFTIVKLLFSTWSCHKSLFCIMCRSMMAVNKLNISTVAFSRM